MKRTLIGALLLLASGCLQAQGFLGWQAKPLYPTSPTFGGTTSTDNITLPSTGIITWTGRGTYRMNNDGLHVLGNAGVTSSVKFRAGIPTVGACGTSPSIAGSDSGMIMTVGTGGVATTCAVNFSAAWSTPPSCVAQNDTDRVAYSIAVTTTAITITATAAFTAGSKFNIICVGL